MTRIHVAFWIVALAAAFGVLRPQSSTAQLPENWRTLPLNEFMGLVEQIQGEGQPPPSQAALDEMAAHAYRAFLGANQVQAMTDGAVLPLVDFVAAHLAGQEAALASSIRARFVDDEKMLLRLSGPQYHALVNTLQAAGTPAAERARVTARWVGASDQVGLLTAPTTLALMWQVSNSTDSAIVAAKRKLAEHAWMSFLASDAAAATVDRPVLADLAWCGGSLLTAEQRKELIERIVGKCFSDPKSTTAAQFTRLQSVMQVLGDTPAHRLDLADKWVAQSNQWQVSIDAIASALESVPAARAGTSRAAAAPADPNAAPPVGAALRTQVMQYVWDKYLSNDQSLKQSVPGILRVLSAGAGALSVERKDQLLQRLNGAVAEDPAVLARLTSEHWTLLNNAMRIAGSPEQNRMAVMAKWIAASNQWQTSLDSIAALLETMPTGNASASLRAPVMQYVWQKYLASDEALAQSIPGVLRVLGKGTSGLKPEQQEQLLQRLSSVVIEDPEVLAKMTGYHFTCLDDSMKLARCPEQDRLLAMAKWVLASDQWKATNADFKRHLVLSLSPKDDPAVKYDPLMQQAQVKLKLGLTE